MILEEVSLRERSWPGRVARRFVDVSGDAARERFVLNMIEGGCWSGGRNGDEH